MEGLKWNWGWEETGNGGGVKGHCASVLLHQRARFCEGMR